VTAARAPRILLRAAAAVALAVLAFGCAGSLLPTVHSQAERLALARRLMEQKKWVSATELVKSYIQNNAGSAEVDQAIYLLGECYLRQKDWGSAAVEFERLIRDYPESDSTPAASFRLGEALYGQARPPDFDQEYTNKALSQWDLYLRSYPGHWLNGEAERKIALGRGRLGIKLLNTGRLYVKLKLPGPARVYFQRVDQDFGDTVLRGEARLGLALCDALDGRREQALDELSAIEAEFVGQPAAAHAARERARLERRHRR
jgi:outer membrane assembly lipoprotein YfiO